MKKTTAYLAAVLLLCAADARAGSAGETGAGFLNLGVGARPAAMAGTFNAAADGATAIFWNAAGLGGLGRPELSLTYADLGFGLSQKSLAFAQPVSKTGGTLAVDFSSLEIADIEGYSPDGTRTGDVKAGDLAAGLAYGRRIFAGLSGGAHFKLIREGLAGENSSTVASDLGLIYQIRRGLGLGVSAMNLGRGLKPGDPLPRTIAAGAAAKFNLMGCGLAFSADQVFPHSGKSHLRLGTEWLLQNVIYLRAGFRARDGLDSGLRYGLGVRTKFIQFDYAFVPRGDFQESHYLTLTARYGRERPLD